MVDRSAGAIFPAVPGSGQAPPGVIALRVGLSPPADVGRTRSRWRGTVQRTARTAILTPERVLARDGGGGTIEAPVELSA
ncbi:hypothetical protein [Nocardia sp. NPDC005366]|uniref:hypothetical protein n=1 Tax=Nocardia sp. NPDC005366 TaxID=3156878 RepID=UPI0033B94CFC